MSTVFTPTQQQPSASAALLPASQALTALLVVDVQVGLNVHDTPYFGKERSNPDFEKNIARLLALVRDYNKSAALPIPIIHINHHSIYPDSPLHPSKPTTSGPQSCAAPLPNETMLHKSANSAFIGTDLENILRTLHLQGPYDGSNNITTHGTTKQPQPLQQLLLCGIATDHCVSTTTRMAADLQVCGGKREGVVLVEDCTACFDGEAGKGGFGVEVVQRVSVESLRGEFCVVARVGEVEGRVLV